MKLNKKGLFYEVILVMFTLIILSTSLYFLLISKGVYQGIGKSSANLIEIDNEARLKLSVIEDVASTSTFYSIIELSNNGGFSHEEILFKDCRTWADCELTKEKLIKNLHDNIDVNFNNFVKRQGINLYNVALSVDGKNTKVKFSNKKAGFNKNNIIFEVNHEFEKEISYDLDKYLELYEKYRNLNLLKCLEFIEDNLVCNEEEESLLFLYSQDVIFYLDEKSKVEYPLKPVITFRLTKPQI